MKTCTKCEVEKELGEFGKNRSTNDGLSDQCKACVNAYRNQSADAPALAKVCTTCNVDKELSEFSKRGKYGKCSQCKECTAAYHKRRVQELSRRDPESLPKKISCHTCGELKSCEDFALCNATNTGRASVCKVCASEYQQSYREARLGYASQLKREYGITLEEYDRMFAQQGGRCAICGTLCDPCNKGIGIFKDNPDVLQVAVDYLRTFQVGPKNVFTVCCPNSHN